MEIPVRPSNESKKPPANRTYASTQVLGEVLRARREELELDLSKVERDTKIRRKYLEYIESGNYARLRDDVYSLGYVKNYADYLGLQTAPILLMYKKERAARTRNLKARGAGQRQRHLQPETGQILHAAARDSRGKPGTAEYRHQRALFARRIHRQDPPTGTHLSLQTGR